MSRILLLLIALITVGSLLSCRDKSTPPDSPDPEAPVGPNLFAVTSVTMTSMALNWNDQSEDEDGFKVENYLEVGDGWSTISVVSPHAGTGTVSYELSNLSPGTTYRLRVVAYNEVGNSTPSNEQTRATDSAPLPRAPSNVTAVALASVTVRVSWQNNEPGDLVAQVVQRHGVEDDWADLALLSQNDYIYFDNTVTALNTYYYRVGARNEIGTAWSQDSATVVTPAPGRPLAPDSLTAQVVMGQRVILRWADRSADETGFELKRGRYGDPLAVIATLGSNVEEYSDELGTQSGQYNYTLRAYNEYGMSEPPAVLAVDYRFCSFGLIPLCAGNWWDYLVTDTIGEDHTFRLNALAPQFIEDTDWYAMRMINLTTMEEDTLHYWRNLAGSGTYELAFPAPAPPVNDLRYQWPASLGSYNIFNGDSIRLINPSMSVQVRTAGGSDTTFNGCIAYEHHFRGTNRWDQVFLRPNDLGIVRIDQYQTVNGLLASRHLVGWNLITE